MYKLPAGFDGAFFLGKRLDLVSFGEYVVHFNFDEGVRVTATSALQHQIGLTSEQSAVQHIPLTESRLMQLVGHSVTQVEGNKEGTLTLLFSNGGVLKIFDDQTHYESYSIYDGERDIYI